MPALMEPVGRAFKRARAAMSRDNEKLDAALAELRKLVASQKSEKDQADKVMAALSKYVTERQQEASIKFNQACSTGTAEEIQSAFEAWVQAKACAAEAQQIVVGLVRASYRDTGAQWLAANPNAKDVLLRVAELRLAAAKDRAAAVLASEQARMGDEFDGHDSPVYKREAGKVSALEAVLNRIQSQPIEDAFTNAAITLLEWDE